MHKDNAQKLTYGIPLKKEEVYKKRYLEERRVAREQEEKKLHAEHARWVRNRRNKM